jgi:glycerol kinase
MAKNSWQMQFLADILNRPVQRPTTTETTALGAASLAALQAGIIGSLDEFADRWQEDVRFEPDMSDLDRQTLLGQWQRAVHSTRTFGESR